MKGKGGRWWVWLTLLVLVIAAAVARWLYSQQISLFFDEFTTLWASQTVLGRGLPLFPSGNFYTHGLLFTYLEAPFLWAFGLEETLLRLPSLLIGVATVLALFFIGRRLFGDSAGLIAAAAVALDPEAIAWGGRVRMYALLQLLVLLAVYTFYQGTIAEDRPRLRWLALGLLVAAMFAHTEAALLLPALGLALLAARGIRWSLRPSVVGPFLLGAAGFVAVFFGLNQGEASHLEAIHQVRPYVTLPTDDLLSGLRGFAPALLDPWRLPFTLAALAGLIYLVRRPERRSPLLYLYLVLGVALVELVFLAGQTWQVPRYAFMLLPLLWLIAGGVASRWLQPRPAWWSAVVALLLAAYVGVVGYSTAFTQEWGYDRAFRYLQDEWKPGDTVLTTNPPASALYLGGADHYAMQFGYEEYVMPGPDGEIVDRWTGAPLLNDVDQLREELSTASRVWLVVDGWRFQSRFDDDFIRTILDQMELVFDEGGMAVFVGEGYAERPQPAVAQSLTTEFGQELALEGYALSSAELKPGRDLEVSLFWRALETPATRYTVFLHLIGPDGQRVAQQDELLLGGHYQPTVWPEGAIVADRHLLALPAGLSPGRYRLDMGLYPPEAAEGQPSPDQGWGRVTLDYLATEGISSPEPDVPLEVDFGGEIRLLGYSLNCEPRATTCGVDLFWQASTDVEADYTVFVHLVGEGGLGAGQHDGMPMGGFYPTSAWEPEEMVVDGHQFDIAADVPPGDYQLVVGLYLLETAERLPVLGPDGQPRGDSVVLETIPIVTGD